MAAAAVACSLFEPIASVFPPKSTFFFLEGVQRGCYSVWLKVVLRECVVIAVSTITILFFPKRKSHVLKIPLMGIKV